MTRYNIMNSGFRKWLENQNANPASTAGISIQRQPQLKEKPNPTISTDTLLAVDEHVERLQQVITQLIFRRNIPNTENLQSSWQRFFQDWGRLKMGLSQNNIQEPGLGSITISPEREAMLRSEQPPAIPNMNGWTASGGLS